MKRLFRSRLGRSAPATRVAIYGLLGMWSLVVAFPLYWLAITSLKEPLAVSDGPFYIPFVDFTPSLHAWRYIFVDLGNDTFRPYVNSLIIATIATALSMLAGSMAAYALNRIAYRPSLGAVILFVAGVALATVLSAVFGVDWRIAAAAGLALFALAARALSRRFVRRLGNADIMFWIISQRILPPVVTAIPIYVMFQQAGLIDTHIALILTYTAANLPIVVWLLYDFFEAIPRELEESAAIDGASRFRIFFEVALPLARPGLVATTLLTLILTWNEYLLALFLSTANAQTMPLLVAAQNATRGPQWWYMSVLIILMIAPVVAMTLALQKFIARGLLVGAVKG